MKNPQVIFGFCAAISATAVASERGAGEEEFSDELNYGFWADWSSRHTSRGRDYLEGRGAFSQGIHFGSGHFGLELNRSGAMEGGTKELNFDLYYYQEFDSFSISGAYEYSDWENDEFAIDGNGLSVGVTYFDLPAGLWISGDVEYSLDRDGFFSELSVGGDLEPGDWMTLTPAVSVGFNSGYFDEGHDGFNHIVASLSADFHLTDHLRLNASAAYNWALNRESDLLRYPDDAILDDFFWTGLTLSFDGDRDRTNERTFSSQESWQVALGTSTWATALSASLAIGSGAPGTVQEIDDSFDQVHTGLSIEANRGPWSILFDGSYVSFGAEVPPPLPIFASTPVEVRMAGVHLAAGYRVYENPRANLDLLAGVRYNYLETEYQFDDPESRKLNWLDPSVGIRGQIEISENVSLSARAEMGGFGVGSDRFWEIDLGLRYQLSNHFSVELRYQQLEVDYRQSNNDLQYTFKGPKIGAHYHF